MPAFHPDGFTFFSSCSPEPWAHSVVPLHLARGFMKFQWVVIQRSILEAFLCLEFLGSPSSPTSSTRAMTLPLSAEPQHVTAILSRMWCRPSQATIPCLTFCFCLWQADCVILLSRPMA